MSEANVRIFIMEEENVQQSGWAYKIKMWILEYKRILIVTKKPTKEEFLTVVKVSALGILVIGLLGFLIQMIEVIIFK